MSQENLIGFAEGVLLLHEKLREFVKQSDLFYDINLLLHQVMDATVKRFSLDHRSTITKNCTIKGKRNSHRSKKECYSLNTSKSDNEVSDLEFIKPCYVKLDKISDTVLSKHLDEKIYSNKIQSERRSMELPGLKSFGVNHNPYKFTAPNKNTDVNIKIDPKFLATEDHLDLLMAREMRSSFLQMEKKVNGRGRCATTKHFKNCQLKPVVLLKRLSPQFISQAINGKLEVESHEFSQRRKQKVSPLGRQAGTNGLRRSERLSSFIGRQNNISLSSEGPNGCFYNRRNSSSRRQYKSKDNKVTVFENKENTPTTQKRAHENNGYSDDEEAFYGFENETKNRQRIKKMKEALKTLNAEPFRKEKRIFKMKKPLKNLRPRPSGKENDSTAILNRDINSFLRYKVPFKAINRNRVEAQSSTNEDNFISKDPTIGDYHLSMRNNHLNDLEAKFRNKLMIRRNNAQDDETPNTDFLTLNRLEILKLFKKREKAVINKMVRDQRKTIVSKTGELLNVDELLNEPLNYYSDKYYFKRIGRRVPLWAEESIRNVIIESQEQIPNDIIVGYFQDHNPFATDPTSIATFLGNAFLEKDETSKKGR